MTDLDQAQKTIQAVCDELTAALRAKGWPEATFSIWVHHDGRRQCNAYIGRAEHPYLPWFDSLPELVGKSREMISALPHRDAEAMAYAEELSAPLFLMSEQLQAAE